MVIRSSNACKILHGIPYLVTYWLYCNAVMIAMNVIQYGVSLTGLYIYPAQMGIASIVHLYVFPAKPYELMGEPFRGNVSVLGDYSADCPLDPDEVRDSERPTKIRLPQPDIDKSGISIRESVRDVFVGGSGYVSLFWLNVISYNFENVDLQFFWEHT